MNYEYFIKHMLQILVSIGVNYPILRNEYTVLQKPLLVITGSGNMETAINFLADSDTPKLNEYFSMKKVLEILNTVNSDFVIYPYTQSKKGNDFLDIISSIVKTGNTGSSNFNALPIVVAENIPYGCNIDRFFIICVDEWSGNTLFNKLDVVPPEDELPVVSDRFNSYAADATYDEKAFLAAASFLYPNFKKENKTKEFSDLIQCTKKIVELDENNHSLNDIGTLFIDELYRWQKDTSFYRVCQLPQIRIYASKKFNQIICFDDDYIYLKEELFKEISIALIDVFPLTMLKRALVDDNILCPNHTSTYTVKMLYCNMLGKNIRERMLRFSRNKLTKIGEPGFVEICQASYKKAVEKLEKKK